MSGHYFVHGKGKWNLPSQMRIHESQLPAFRLSSYRTHSLGCTRFVFCLESHQFAYLLYPVIHCTWSKCCNNSHSLPLFPAWIALGLFILPGPFYRMTSITNDSVILRFQQLRENLDELFMKRLTIIRAPDMISSSRDPCMSSLYLSSRSSITCPY